MTFDRQFIEQPDRLIIGSESGYQAGVTTSSVFLAVIVVGMWFVAFAFAFKSMNWNGIGFGFASGLLVGSGSMLLLLVLISIPSPMFSIYANGWVRAGWAAWRFPGPMLVRCIVVQTGGPANIRGITVQREYEQQPKFQLSYGMSSLHIPSSGSINQTMDFAQRAEQWARRRISGAPSIEKVPEDQFVGKWVFIYLVISLFVLFAATTSSSNLNMGYYLNQYAAPGAWAVRMATGSAVVGLAIGGWHWIELAQRQIKASAIFWIVDVLVVLLLVAAGCSVALYFGQIYDMRTLPSREVTLLQPVRYSSFTDKYGCHLSLLIHEPTLGETASSGVGNCNQADYWRSGAGVEIRQTENDLGVHILSVRRIETSQ
jgi:hypothetical protein